MSEYPISQDLKALTEERDYFRGQYHAKLVRESQLLDDLIKTTKNLETELESVLSLQGQVKSLEAQNKALEWKPITADNLPKVGDEVLDRNGTVQSVDSSDVAVADEWGIGYWKYSTHFRAINPPAIAQAKEQG